MHDGGLRIMEFDLLGEQILNGTFVFTQIYINGQKDENGNCILPTF